MRAISATLRAAIAIALLVEIACLPADALTGPRRALLGGGNPAVQLSGSSVLATASIGTTVGTLSVGHPKGTYTYSLTSNPGTLFSISGNLLQTAAALSIGTDPIVIQANNGAGNIISQPFTITVTGAAVACANGNLLLVYSDPCQLMSQMAGN